MIRSGTTALPITPSGLGVRENLFVFMLADPSIAVAATPALSLSLLAYAGSLLWSLVGGVVYLMFREKHHLAETELEVNKESDPGENGTAQEQTKRGECHGKSLATSDSPREPQRQ